MNCYPTVQHMLCKVDVAGKGVDKQGDKSDNI